MLFVIFGAGASFDSLAEEDLDPTKPERDFWPPLTQDLFANRAGFRKILQRYPECIPIIPLLRPLRTTQETFLFERVLASLVQEAESGGKADRHRQVAAVAHYLRDVLKKCTDDWETMSGGATNYAALAGAIKQHQLVTKEPVRFVTFNYDLLLDRAISRWLDAPFERIADYVSRDDIRLYRPHGAVNWVRDIDNTDDIRQMHRDQLRRQARNGRSNVVRRPITPSELIELRPHIQLGQQVEVVNKYTSDVCWPALAVPIEGKDSFEFPAGHRDRLEEDIGRASAVLIVGWRGMETAFNQLWADHMPPDTPVQIVASTHIEAFKIASRLREANWKMKSLPSASEGFSHYIRTRGEQTIFDEHRRTAGYSHNEEGAQRRFVAIRHMQALDSYVPGTDADQLHNEFMERHWLTM